MVVVRSERPGAGADAARRTMNPAGDSDLGSTQRRTCARPGSRAAGAGRRALVGCRAGQQGRKRGASRAPVTPHAQGTSADRRRGMFAADRTVAENFSVAKSARH